MNKRIIICLFYLAFLKTAWCGVTFRIADPNTLLPLSSQEILLGSSVALVIHSDANEPWKGGLFIQGQQRALAILNGRGQSTDTRNYPESCLASAGDYTRATRWKDSYIWGFDFYSDDVLTRPGDWFVVEYLSLEPGFCHVEFYEYTDPNAFCKPKYSLQLENTPSRDFSGNGVVNLEDYLRFASKWMEENCDDPDWCGQTDLDRDGTVALADLLMFSEHWLWGIPGWKPAPPPGLGTGQADPNVIYSITDSQGLNEIELPVGESITLYMNKTTLEKDVFIFRLEAVISDTTLGWIDNTEYDPNNPPGPGTARILAGPRMTFFDYWGPGLAQWEGIQMMAANPGNPIQDGHLSSFVYTAVTPGEVTLSLVDYESIPASLHSLMIHQTDLMETAGTDSDRMTLSADLETEQTETTPEYSTEEMVDVLETIWEEEPEVQQIISQEEWDTFIEKVQTDIE